MALVHHAVMPAFVSGRCVAARGGLAEPDLSGAAHALRARDLDLFRAPGDHCPIAIVAVLVLTAVHRSFSDVSIFIGAASIGGTGRPVPRIRSPPFL
jgi:hypothetical protein